MTALLTPYLIRLADPLSRKLAGVIPPKVAGMFGMYALWLDSLQLQGDRTELTRIVRCILAGHA